MKYEMMYSIIWSVYLPETEKCQPKYLYHFVNYSAPIVIYNIIKCNDTEFKRAAGPN